MIKENQFVEIKWNSQTKKYWENKGYKYTKVGEKFTVKVDELPPKSSVFIDVICDYCGNVFKTRMYSYTSNSACGKIACSYCKGKKGKETSLIKYGVENVMQLDNIKDKFKNTLLQKYGVDSPLKNKDLVQKAQSHIDYKERNKKIKETCLKKYGVDNVGKCQEFIQKSKITCLNKYGGYSSQCSKEIRQKSFNTMLNNGSIPSSRPEREMISLIKEIYGENNCIEQYIYDKIIFDCLLIINDIKIDIEYDGIYWHDKERDKRRDYFSIRKGFKVLRFRSNTSVPNKEQIKNSVDYLLNSDHKILIIDI